MGDINGTHDSAFVPAVKAMSRRRRKNEIILYVMCACNFNMQFTHVHVEREGSVKLLMTQSDPKHGFPWFEYFLTRV